MKIEWLVTNLTSVESPDRAKRDILGTFLNIFLLVQAVIVTGEPLCGMGIPSRALVTLLRAI